MINDLIFYLFRNFNQINLRNAIIPLDKTTDSLDLELINKIIALISNFRVNFKLIFIYRGINNISQPFSIFIKFNSLIDQFN